MIKILKKLFNTPKQKVKPVFCCSKCRMAKTNCECDPQKEYNDCGCPKSDCDCH